MLSEIMGWRYPVKLLIKLLKDGAESHNGYLRFFAGIALRIVRHKAFFHSLLLAGVCFDIIHAYLTYRHAVSTEEYIGSGSVGLLALNELCEVCRD